MESEKNVVIDVGAIPQKELRRRLSIVAKYITYLQEERRGIISIGSYNKGKCDVLEPVITDLASILGSDLPDLKSSVERKIILPN